MPKDHLSGIISITPDGWPADYPLNYNFTIAEPEKGHDFIYQVAYQPDFFWENVWLSYCLTDPSGDTVTCSTDNLFLFEPSSGKPIGSGPCERLYLNAYFIRNLKLKKSGNYRISVQHKMRTDTLHGLENIGIRVADTD